MKDSGVGWFFETLCMICIAGITGVVVLGVVLLGAELVSWILMSLRNF